MRNFVVNKKDIIGKKPSNPKICNWMKNMKF